MSEPRYPYERDLNALIREVQAAQREVALQVRLALREGQLQTQGQRLLQVAAVVAILDQLGPHLDPAARSLVRDAYTQGNKRAEQQAARIMRVPFADPGVNAETISVLQDSLVDHLQTTRRIVGRQINDLYARAGRRAALRAVREGDLRSGTRQMFNDLMRDREIARTMQQGGYGFVDRAGKRWALSTYVEMAVRTTTREAVVQGALDRFVAHGITVLRWSEHGDACPICKPWLGRLVTLNGDTRPHDDRIVVDILATPGIPAHPNCKCSWLPIASREPLRQPQSVVVA